MAMHRLRCKKCDIIFYLGLPDVPDFHVERIHCPYCGSVELEEGDWVKYADNDLREIKSRFICKNCGHEDVEHSMVKPHRCLQNEAVAPHWSKVCNCRKFEVVE